MRILKEIEIQFAPHVLSLAPPRSPGYLVRGRLEFPVEFVLRMNERTHTLVVVPCEVRRHRSSYAAHETLTLIFSSKDGPVYANLVFDLEVVAVREVYG